MTTNSKQDESGSESSTAKPAIVKKSVPASTKKTASKPTSSSSAQSAKAAPKAPQKKRAPSRRKAVAEEITPFTSQRVWPD